MAGPGVGDRGLRRASASTGAAAARRRRDRRRCATRSCRPGCGSSRPVRVARPTPPTPTPSPWSESAWTGLRRWSPTTRAWTVLRLLADRRRRIGAEHTRKVCQLHALLLELLPGGAKKDLSAAQARNCSRACGHATWPGRHDAALAVELVADLERVYARKKAANKELVALIRRDRHRAARPARHRPLRRRPAAGRGRRHHPVPDQRPLRVLDRHRPHRRLLRRQHPSPALPGREPADQHGPSHHGHRPAAQRHTRTCLLRPEKAAGKTLQRSHALPQTQTVRHRLPHHARRLSSQHQRGRAREGTGATTLTPARPAHNPNTSSSDKPLPGPATASLEPHSRQAVLTQKGAMRGRCAAPGWTTLP